MKDVSQRKPILLVLDLDETLIHAREEPFSRPADFRVSQFHVYRRPYLAEFILACAQWYNLAIWSSASDEYVQAVTDEIIPKSIDLQFVWGRSRNTIRRLLVSDLDEALYARGNTNYQKHLKKLKSFGWPLDKILIIDDSPEKSVQNYGNAIYPLPYEGDENDDELKFLAKYLESLKDSENVRKIEKRGWRTKLT